MILVGELLNRQFGFSDSDGTWTCTNCGHINGITEEDIIEDNKKCPHCGANLKKQDFHSEYDDDWECTECGTKLHRNYSDEPYVEAEYLCPNCSAPIDWQWCFGGYENDWECTECHSKLHRDYSFEQFEVVRDEDSEDDDDTETEEDFEEDEYNGYEDTDEFVNRQDTTYHNQNYSNSSRVNEETVKSTSKAKLKIESIKRKINTFFKRLVITCIVLLTILSGAYLFFEERKNYISAPYSREEIIGLTYEEAINKLTETGFTNINKKEIDDLTLPDEYLAGIITNITIDHGEVLQNKKYRYDSNIELYYHTLHLLTPPIANSGFKEMNSSDVRKAFEEVGFVNVSEEVIYDVIIGIFTKAGDIEAIVIDGDKKYSETSTFRPDVSVVIQYHDLKKNNPALCQLNCVSF